MKGQAINIDWTVGLTLFLFTALSAIFLMGTTNFGSAETLRSIASDIHDDLAEEASAQAVRANLTAQTSENIENIPVDQKFHTQNVEDWKSSKPVYINSTENRFISVVNSGESFQFTYFTENITSESSYSDLRTDSNWINNSKISVKLNDTGVSSITHSGKKFFKQISLTGNPDPITGKIFADAFSGNLTAYNSSSEIILKEEQISLKAGNYSTIYWHPSEEQNLNEGYSRQTETQGFSIANSSQGITFVGDMEAKVEKTDSTIHADINASNLRIRVHEADVSYGEKRIRNSAEGEIFVGAREELKLLSSRKLEDLDNLSEQEFQEKLGLENLGYKIEVTGNETYLSKGGSIPSLTDALVVDRNTQLILSNGTEENVEISVGVWE